MSDRVLLYTCCDNDYTHFVPLYCAAALFSNENIDIEIGINLNRLTDLEEEAMHNLMILHPESKIKIKYNFYSKKSMFTHMNALFDGKCMWSNTVRFVSVPDIKNKYTYIGDIDVVLLMKNFYTYHINIMNEYNVPYSNWIRNNDPLALTGLHFVETDSFYSRNIDGINLNENDERILKKIQESVCELNPNIPQRPVCGLHFSKNQRLQSQFKLSKIFLDELESYKDSFFEFIKSKEYNIVKSCNTNLINEYIDGFTKHFNER